MKGVIAMLAAGSGSVVLLLSFFVEQWVVEQVILDMEIGKPYTINCRILTLS